MKLKATAFEPMDPGDYLARFTGYEEDEGVHGPFVKVEYEVLDEEYAGKFLTGIASAKFNPATKLWAWVEALLGRPIESGEEIDLDDLKGHQCVLVIEHQKNERGTFERITAVRPVRKKKGQPESEADEKSPNKGDSETDDFDDLPW